MKGKTSQRRIAAKILKCGENKIWIDPNSNITQAITRKDIRKLIDDKKIKKIKNKIHAQKIFKRKQKIGSRKGKKHARQGKKTNWFKKIRPQRKLLKELREKNKLNPNAYRKIYKMTKGNFFRNRTHLISYIKDKKMINEKNDN